VTLREALKIKLKKKQKIDWHSDDNNLMSKQFAYNCALDDIAYFIDKFFEGEIAPEYLNELKRQQG
jgi:hypothetical protein